MRAASSAARTQHVDDEQRQLECDGEPDRLRLEDDPRPRGGGHAERAAEGSAESCPRRGDLVLGLERAHAEVLQLGELLEDVRRRRDGIGAEEEREPRELAGSDKAVRQRRVSRNLAIGSWLEGCRRDLVRDREIL